MIKRLEGEPVAILVSDGFEQVEFEEPKKALEAMGALTRVVAPAGGKVQGCRGYDKRDLFPVDTPLGEAEADDFDALFIAGIVLNPLTQRIDHRVVPFIHGFVRAGKPIAAIGHGPWTLIAADILRGKLATSTPALRADLEKAGARWVNEAVVLDRGLVTSRGAEDIPAFNLEMIRAFARSRRAGVIRAGLAGWE